MSEAYYPSSYIPPTNVDLMKYYTIWVSNFDSSVYLETYILNFNKCNFIDFFSILSWPIEKYLYVLKFYFFFIYYFIGKPINILRREEGSLGS